MKFSELYDVAFPETKIEIKTKNLLSPWLKKGLRKSSKRKHIKSTWKIMKEIVGKAKINQKNLPKQLVINNKKITDKTEIANNFNEFFANFGPKLAEKIPDVNKKF